MRGKPDANCKVQGVGFRGKGYCDGRAQQQNMVASRGSQEVYNGLHVRQIEKYDCLFRHLE